MNDNGQVEQPETSPRHSGDATKQLELSIDIWKKTVDVQMHFNDIEMRIRNLAITVLTTVLGAAGFGMQSDYAPEFMIGIVLTGIIAWLLFYFMDRFWYHQLLHGAVEQGRMIEKSLRQQLPAISLGENIASKSARLGKYEVHSDTKISLFYFGGLSILVVILLIGCFLP